MPVNMTLLKSAEGVGGLVWYANYSTDGLLFTLFTIAMFFIILFALKRWEFDKALLAASWVSFLISIILVGGEFVSLYVALVYLTIAAFTALFVWTTRNG